MSSAVAAQAPPSADPELRSAAPVDANRPYAQELRSSAAPDLVLAIAGSLAISSSAATLPAWDPKVIELLSGSAFPESATVAMADLQATLIDRSRFGGYPYPWADAFAYAAPPGIAAEIRQRGLTMLARANGHALDWGVEGMRATSAALDAVGLTHAGTGEREGLARMASFLDEPRGKGRIGLLSTATGFRPTTNALSPHGAARGRPGISGLDVASLRVVPVQQLGELQRMACRFRYPEDVRHCDGALPSATTVSIFGNRYASSSVSNEHYTSTYELNPAQVASELRLIREAKQNSDLVAFSVHTDQQQRPDASASVPPPAIVQVARAAIDAGADLVMATGRSALGPIEIYQPAGQPPRPILYGMGNLYRSPDLPPTADMPEAYESIIVRSHIVGSTVTVEIYPIDLHAAGGPAGVPRLAGPDVARAVLERLQRLSAPFHTDIRLESYGATLRGLISVTQKPRAKADGGP